MAKISYPHPQAPVSGEVVEVASGVYWARLPLPMSLNHINVYLLQTKAGWYLVDTGIKGDEAQLSWKALIKNVIKKDAVLGVIVTHLHPDHIGQAGWLVEQFKAPLMMTQLEYYQACTYANSRFDHMPWQMTEFYKQAGLPDETLAMMSNAGFGRFGDAIEPIPASFTRLQDQQQIQLGDISWQVVVGSGHSPEHLCLYSKKLNVLISGDQVLPVITSNVSVSPSDQFANPLAEWLFSLAKFKVIPEDALVLPSHNLPFFGLHGRLDYLIYHHEERMLCLEQHCAEAKTAFQLVPLMFKRELDTRQTMMALGECLAHLKLLVERGRLQRQVNNDGVAYYLSIAEDFEQRNANIEHIIQQEVPLFV